MEEVSPLSGFRGEGKRLPVASIDPIDSFLDHWGLIQAGRMGTYVDMCEYIVSLFLLQINEKMCFCVLLLFNPKCETIFTMLKYSNALCVFYI